MKQHNLLKPENLSEILKVSLSLLEKMISEGFEVGLLGVAVSDFVDQETKSIKDFFQNPGAEWPRA